MSPDETSPAPTAPSAQLDPSAHIPLDEIQLAIELATAVSWAARGMAGERPAVVSSNGNRWSTASPGSDQGLTPQWLAEYLQRRIHVTAWLLDHWNSSPPTQDSVVDAAQAHETLVSLERIFAAVRQESDLRARLGWANGPLADDRGGQPFVAAVDWPEEFQTTLPVRGGLGFFLTEVLSNVMRHGVAGSAPQVTIRCDRVKRELACAVLNQRRDDRVRAGSQYGGIALLTGMARLFGWREFTAGPDGPGFVVSWRAPLTRRDEPGQPD